MEFVDLVISVSTIISIVIAVASLAYWLGRKFTQLNDKFKLIDERFKLIDERFNRLENAFIQFSDILLTVLGSKGVLAETEVVALRGVARSLIPGARSKYYTEEVRRRLISILDKHPREYTMADIEELGNIADLIEKEGFETQRKDLQRYSWLLRYYAMVVRAVYIYPKLAEPYMKEYLGK